MKSTACYSLAICCCLTMYARGADGLESPNILWIFAEDTSPWMGCYGDTVNAHATPNFDAMANSGVRFERAYVPAPVCSACRSAMMGGQNQIRFGAHEHRSSRGRVQNSLPEGMKLLPQLMKENGYFTFNFGKTDYNFVFDSAATYSIQNKQGNVIPWATLQDNQPFFGQIQTQGGKTNTQAIPEQKKTEPNDVSVPADYPQNDLYHEVVAQHYDAIRMEDDRVGQILRELRTHNLAENTIVVYFSDHGANHLVRHKQMVTEGGLHVPLIITGPEEYVLGPAARNDLVSLLDVSATTLVWGGVEVPDWFEGRDLFAEHFTPREFVASAKDRMDHTIDRCRSVRTDRFRYTRNYKLDRIFLQPQYRDAQPYTQNLWELYETGELSDKLTEIYFGERPAEELYDVSADPAQINNLAGDPAFREELVRHRRLLDAWLAKGDLGEGEEPDAEMAFQAETKKWTVVNPEYERIRTDSDGDGLSDPWETYNQRDPNDGRLLFNFDCGGWQTEGWRPVGIDANIAGRLGYLDFPLETGTGAIRRDDLNAATTATDAALVIRLRTSKSVMVRLQMNGEDIARTKTVSASDAFSDICFPLANEPNWKGTIRSLVTRFDGKRDALIEIDAIYVERN